MTIRRCIVKTGRFLGQRFNTPLCEKMSSRRTGPNRRLAIQQVYGIRLYVEPQGSIDSYHVYVVRSSWSADSPIPERLQLFLCEMCCKEAGHLLKSSSSSISDLELGVEWYGQVDEPLIVIRVRGLQDLEHSTPRKPVGYQPATNQGLWWHSSSRVDSPGLAFQPGRPARLRSPCNRPASDDANAGSVWATKGRCYRDSLAYRTFVRGNGRRTGCYLKSRARCVQHPGNEFC